jgi:hypothetical protein
VGCGYDAERGGPQRAGVDKTCVCCVPGGVLARRNDAPRAFGTVDPRRVHRCSGIQCRRSAHAFKLVSMDLVLPRTGPILQQHPLFLLVASDHQRPRDVAAGIVAGRTLQQTHRRRVWSALV